MRPVGVLALQGDYAEHEAALQRAGLTTIQIRKPDQLWLSADSGCRDPAISALVLPGGESTTMLRLLQLEGLWGPLGELLASGLPVLATCAGLILLASEVTQPEQESYGLLDMTVQRNGYGRQAHSGTFPIEGSELPAGTTGVFIRAPRILRAGPAVEVMARREGEPVLVRSGPILAACFHPELQPSHWLTARFAQLATETALSSR